VAHSLSAKKRIRQNEKSRTINRARKSMVKTQTKHFEDALKSGDLANAEQQLKKTVRLLDKVGATSTMHKNTVARVKSRLTRLFNKAKEA
jgi:small subunit ribosomal protein S20